MDARAAQLIAQLGLSPHPEGGFFREIHRSPARVAPLDGRAERSALTSIYYLLTYGQISRWHRVASDEAWHFLEGHPLELFQADDGFENVTTAMLGPAGDVVNLIHVVPANYWQAARGAGDYTLAGCTVGPGFEYADFKLLRDSPGDSAILRRRYPDFSPFM